MKAIRVRLPADIPVSEVSVKGTQHDLCQDGGRTIVEYSGILHVRGEPVLSPGQLLALWKGQAVIEYVVADATLSNADLLPVADRARLGAYAIATESVERLLAMGHSRDKVPMLLEELRKRTAAGGRKLGRMPSRRAYFADVDRCLRHMAAAWTRALSYAWENDS